MKTTKKTLTKAVPKKEAPASKQKKAGRFSNVLGSEYGRLHLAIPHLDKIQAAIAKKARTKLPPPHMGLRMVLDLGCGNGYTTAAFAEGMSYAFIVGVDDEKIMLRQYKQRARQIEKKHRNGLSIQHSHQDVLVYLKKCNRSSVDVVISGFMLHNLPIAKRTRIVKEIFRVLRPGGRFVNGDKIARVNKKRHAAELLAQIGAFAKTYAKPTDAEYGLMWTEHYIRDDQPDLRYTTREVRKALRAAGFKRVQIGNRHGLDAVVTAIK